MRRRRGLLPLGLLLSAYLLLAAAYGVSIPLWEAPDAIWHYQFAAHLAAGGGLPGRADVGPAAPWRQEASQPPLYYLAAAPWIALVRPTDGGTAIRANPHAKVGVTDAGGNLNSLVHGARELHAAHSRHSLVGDQRVDAIRRAPQHLESARGVREAQGLVTE